MNTIFRTYTRLLKCAKKNLKIRLMNSCRSRNIFLNTTAKSRQEGGKTREDIMMTATNGRDTIEESSATSIRW